MKLRGIRIGKDFKPSADGKIVKDEKAIEARLDVPTRLKRRSSKRITVSRNPRQRGE